MLRSSSLPLPAALAAGALVFAAPLRSAPQSATKEAPPGMVLVDGGNTKIGLAVDDLEDLLEEREEFLEQRNALAASVPARTERVADFFLMVNEVTNEQYEVFCRATGHRVPEHWGVQAIDDASSLFLREYGRTRQEAKEKGEPVPPITPDPPFNRSEWWAKNWSTAQWAVPAGAELEPVVFVDYQDALAYARWAGLRLPTEEEYHRAVRGDSDRPWPWGDEWDNDKYASTNYLSGARKAYPVGSFPAGASEDGIFDLAGNVWEWTSSPFRPFPKYKMPKFKMGRGSNRKTIECLPSFDPNQRVCVGGSFQNAAHVAKVWIRRGTERFQLTNGVGFRCAASTTPGVDMAETALREDLPPSTRPRDSEGPVEYLVGATLAMDRWETEGGREAQSGIALPGDDKAPKSTVPPPGYAVITGYDYALFTPVGQLKATQESQLDKMTVEEAVAHIGFLSTNQPILEPALEPGSYLIAYRAGGEPRQPATAAGGTPAEGEAPAEGQDEEAAPKVDPKLEFLAKLRELEGFDVEQPHLLFFDGSGAPVAAVRMEKKLDYGRISPGSITPYDQVIREPQLDAEGNPVLDEKEKPVVLERTEKWIRFAVMVPGRQAGRGFSFEIPLKFPTEVLEKTWRGPTALKK